MTVFCLFPTIMKSVQNRGKNCHAYKRARCFDKASSEYSLPRMLRRIVLCGMLPPFVKSYASIRGNKRTSLYNISPNPGWSGLSNRRTQSS